MNATSGVFGGTTTLQALRMFGIPIDIGVDTEQKHNSIA